MDVLALINLAIIAGDTVRIEHQWNDVKKSEFRDRVHYGL